MMTAGTHGAPKAKINSVNPCLRFIGLIPIATDWHSYQTSNASRCWIRFFISELITRTRQPIWYKRCQKLILQLILMLATTFATQLFMHTLYQHLKSYIASWKFDPAMDWMKERRDIILSFFLSTRIVEVFIQLWTGWNQTKREEISYSPFYVQEFYLVQQEQTS